MKIKKTNSVKILALTLALSTTVFISCDESKKDKKSDNIEVVNDNYDTENNTSERTSENMSEETPVKRRTLKMKDGTTLKYDYDNVGVVALTDWSDYSIVNSELANFKKANYTTRAERIRKLNYKVANLENTIPSWLKTEEVMEDLRDVQDDYATIISDADATEAEMKENLEEFTEEFDEFRNEINETIEKYIEEHEEAIEEFNEEMKNGELDDAIEEYNEEIEDIEAIAKMKK